MDLDLSIKLCQTTRSDLLCLQAALERKSFFDVGPDVGQSAVDGMAFKDLGKELTWLEQLITVENYQAICQHPWAIFDLVNFYDRLIDQVNAEGIQPGKAPAIVDSLYRWRNNAGQLAQMVCQIEDAENP